MSIAHRRLGAMLTLSLAASAACAAPPLYRVTYLGALTPGLACTASDINLQGQAVGSCGGTRLFIHTAATGMQEIAVPVPHVSVSAQAINQAGTVAGTVCTLSKDDCEPFVWDAARGMRLLGHLNQARRTVARDINDRGQMVGVDGVPTTASQGQAFLWSEKTGIVGLKSGQQPATDAAAINNLGQIGGRVTGRVFHGNYISEPVIVDKRKTVTRLGDLPTNPDGQVQGLNDLGQAVGWSGMRAFFWSASEGMRDIDGRTGEFSAASDINNHGQVVGYRTVNVGSATGHFYWDAVTGMVDIYSVLDPDDALSQSTRIDATYRIKDSGQITVSAAVDGLTSAVILTPVR